MELNPHLPAQSKQKHKNKVWSMFKVDNKDTRMTPLRIYKVLCWALAVFFANLLLRQIEKF